MKDATRRLLAPAKDMLECVQLSSLEVVAMEHLMHELQLRPEGLDAEHAVMMGRAEEKQLVQLAVVRLMRNGTAEF